MGEGMMDIDDLPFLAARLDKIEEYLSSKFEDFEPIVGTAYDPMRGSVYVTQAENEKIRAEARERERKAREVTEAHGPVCYQCGKRNKSAVRINDQIYCKPCVLRLYK